MSLRTAEYVIDDARQSLGIAWSNVRDRWTDSAARTFETEVLEELDTRIRHAKSALEAMDAVISQARLECGS